MDLAKLAECFLRAAGGEARAAEVEEVGASGGEEEVEPLEGPPNLEEIPSEFPRLQRAEARRYVEAEDLAGEVIEASEKLLGLLRREDVRNSIKAARVLEEVEGDPRFKLVLPLLSPDYERSVERYKRLRSVLKEVEELLKEVL